MRANEFITDDLDLSHKPTKTGGVEIRAKKDQKEAGFVVFQRLDGNKVKAVFVWVPERLRRTGIGSAMYRYARDKLGLDIVPSDSQTDLGKKFWTQVHELES